MKDSIYQKILLAILSKNFDTVGFALGNISEIAESASLTEEEVRETLRPLLHRALGVNLKKAPLTKPIGFEKD